MNEVIESLKGHRSFRSYENRPVEEEHLDQIIEAVQAAPNWINGQQYSIVAVKDEENKRRLAELCGPQKHIEEAPVFLVFCADFYRTQVAGEMEGQELNISSDIDSLLVGVTDVGIALGTAVAAAESVGLGTVAIGGIRKNSAAVIDLLELPEYVIPVSGLCIGHPAGEAEQKPRLPKAAIYHEEQYNRNQQPLLEKYNEVYSRYLGTRSDNSRVGNWTGFVSKFFSRQYYQGVDEMLRKQKFPGS